VAPAGLANGTGITGMVQMNNDTRFLKFYTLAGTFNLSPARARIPRGAFGQTRRLSAEPVNLGPNLALNRYRTTRFMLHYFQLVVRHTTGFLTPGCGERGPCRRLDRHPPGSPARAIECRQRPHHFRALCLEFLPSPTTAFH